MNGVSKLEFVPDRLYPPSLTFECNDRSFT